MEAIAEEACERYCVVAHHDVSSTLPKEFNRNDNDNNKNNNKKKKKKKRRDEYLIIKKFQIKYSVGLVVVLAS